MKNHAIYILLVAFATLAISCSSEDGNNSNANNDYHALTTITKGIICGEDMANYSGTICCIIGSDIANPNDTLTFTYESNRSNFEFDWVVSSGAMTIVSGANTKSVTIQFGSNFNGGTIKCLADGHLACQGSLEIGKE